jgi:UDP-glucose 4-epimerase
LVTSEKQRVLVTGGAGFIGSHVAERFEREGFAVRVLDNLTTGQRDNLSESWEWIDADVRDAAAVNQAANDVHFVAHLAAFVSLPASFERHGDCYETNVQGTFNVLEACRANAVEKLVFASSSAVYQEEPAEPKAESECPNPVSPYATSKLEGEHLLAAFGAHHGLASVAFRFFNVYGPRQPADSAYAAAVPIFIERGLRNKAAKINGDGSQTRDFVFVEDVANAVVTACQSESTGVYNVGTGTPTPILELANTIAKVTGVDGDPEFGERRQGDLRASTADTTRIRNDLGWSPSFTLEEGLRETLAWYRARAERDC